jgi:hypothetical protein
MHGLWRAAQAQERRLLLLVRFGALFPCRQNAQHHPELKEWRNKPVLTVRAAADEPTRPADSSLRPKPHNARPIFTLARAAGCCAFDKRAEKGETALRQRPCATNLPPSRVPDKGAEITTGQGRGRHRRSTFSSERYSCHASARGKPICCALPSRHAQGQRRQPCRCATPISAGRGARRAMGFQRGLARSKPTARAMWLILFGSPGRTRTSDPAVNSRLLYRLSYRGTTGRI